MLEDLVTVREGGRTRVVRALGHVFYPHDPVERVQIIADLPAAWVRQLDEVAEVVKLTEQGQRP